MKINTKLAWNSELAMSVLFFGVQFNYYIANILDANGLPSVAPFMYAIIYVTGLFSYCHTLRRKKALIAFSVMAMLVAMSYGLNYWTRYFMLEGTRFTSPLFVLTFIYFPIFLLWLSGIDFKKLIYYFEFCAPIAAVLGVSSFCVYVFGKKMMPPEYMAFAYMMMPSVLICFVFGLNGKKCHLVLACISAFVNMIVGCRGAAVSIVVFLMLSLLYFFHVKRKTSKNRLTKILVFLLLFAIAVNIGTILNEISDTMEKYGLESRTINKLLDSESSFDSSSGRDSIFKQAINNISLFGEGLFGDRAILHNENGALTYAHNFILEIMVDFGLIVGAVVLIVFFALIIKATHIAIASRDSALTGMTFLMLAGLLVKHMVSASFLTSFDFWFYVGLAAHIVINRRDLKRSTV